MATLMIGGLRERLHQHPRYRWMVLVTVASGMMMAILSSSIVNIALPAISSEFGSSLTATTWVATIYMIMQATFMPVSGRAGDIYGHKRIFVSGLLLFTAMSVFCTFAWGVNSLIAGRGLMAIGTSALAPMALTFVMREFPGKERAQALGVMGGLMGSAPTLGMVGGGFLVQAFGWRSVFLIAVPLCVVVVPLALLVLRAPQERPADRSFDIAGSILLTVGLFAGLLALSQGRTWGWLGRPTLTSFLIFALMLGLFLLWERRVERPLLDLKLFRLRSLVSANFTGFFASAAMFGTLVLLPFYFQSVLGQSAAEAGLQMAPMALMYLIVSPIGGRLTNRLGARNTPLLGLCIAAAGYVIVSQVISMDAGVVALAMAISISGIGLGLVMAPITTAALHDVPTDKRGVAASLPQMSRFVGGSFGIAMVGSVLSWRAAAHLSANPEAAGAVTSAGASVSAANVSANPAAQEVFTQAFSDVFMITVILVLGAMIAAAFIPRLRHYPEEHGPAGHSSGEHSPRGRTAARNSSDT